MCLCIYKCVCVCVWLIHNLGQVSQDRTKLLPLMASAFFILQPFNYSQWKNMEILALSLYPPHTHTFSKSLSPSLCPSPDGPPHVARPKSFVKCDLSAHPSKRTHVEREETRGSATRAYLTKHARRH